VNTYTEERDLLNILRDLVEALDRTYWSSWQTTAKFDAPLSAAREAIKKADDYRGSL
jgi:uncharacterized caspase-like protein